MLVLISHPIKAHYSNQHAQPLFLPPHEDLDLKQKTWDCYIVDTAQKLYLLPGTWRVNTLQDAVKGCILEYGKLWHITYGWLARV